MNNDNLDVKINAAHVHQIAIVFVKADFTPQELVYLKETAAELFYALYTDLVKAIAKQSPGAKIVVSFQSTHQAAAKVGGEEAVRLRHTLISQVRKAAIGKPASGIPVRPYEFVVQFFLISAKPQFVVAEENRKLIPLA